MISLLEAQRWMKTRILPAERVSSATVAVELNPQGGEPGEERLGVYSGGYTARMREALEEAYPAVRHVLGRHAFSELARDYAVAHPSRDYNLSLAGRHLPDFLPGTLLSKELPFLPDLARLEWQVVESFHAFDLPPLDPSHLAAVPPEEWGRLRLVFQPSVRRIASEWPILDVWEARDRPVSETRIELVNRPQKILVHRNPSAQVCCELLDVRQDAVLEALIFGKTLGELSESLAGDPSGDEESLPAWFARWNAVGLISDITFLSERHE